jgi:hypothetical protein
MEGKEENDEEEEDPFHLNIKILHIRHHFYPI